MSARLAGKVAIVMGAGQTPGDTIGNGRATAILFAREGARVIAVDRRFGSAEETVERIHGEDGEAEAYGADATHEPEVDAANACGSSGLGEASAGPRPPGTSCAGFPGRDWDTDGRIDLSDVCPTVFDPAQPDAEADRVGDACDNCPALFNSDQGDADRDGLGDLCQP